MKAHLTALASGLLFGLGLGVSGMTLPSKVIGFLDVTGAWDASLAFVMIGAIAVHAVLFRVVTRRVSPLFDAEFHIPSRRDVDGPLVLGAALFGVGWGLGGYCPGPALVTAATGSVPALIFVVAMIIGMLLERATQARNERRRPSEARPSTPLVVSSGSN